jgi:hypothetical protein
VSCALNLKSTFLFLYKKDFNQIWQKW